jgi:hypothetical protein
LKEEDRKDEVTKVNEEERSSEEEDEDEGEKYTVLYHSLYIPFST